MTLRPLLTLLLSLALYLPAASPWAADQADLKEWRERILRSLEREEVPGRDSAEAPREGLVDQRTAQAGADAAAAQAQKQYGGRVLAVSRSRGAYRVRLLLDDGRVTTVTVPD